jgi:succinate dehydrogenase/fumarate reductase flavoprotein subunit
MNEYQPYTQDTSWRAMTTLDTETMSYLRIPSYMIMDDAGRGAYPIVSPTFNDRRFTFEWSEASLRELESRIIKRAESIIDLAAIMQVDAQVLAETIRQWNAACDAGKDEVHGRPPTSMVKVAAPPFFVAEVYPICSNTHGGPVHDAEQRVLDSFGVPIPRLFAAGELGGVFGHLYISGGNLAECFVGGRTAGRNAGGMDAWDAGVAAEQAPLERRG